jgi:ComF family protein
MRNPHAALRAVADLIWPPRSLLSDRQVGQAGAIEAELWRALKFLGAPWCDRCGMPFETEEPPGTHCPACIAAPPAYDKARAALVYDDLSRKLVLDLKRAGRRDGLGVFAGWMAEAGGELVADADILVPAPLHWMRLAGRGFNQAVWLGEAFSRRTGLPLARAALVRTKRRRSQEGLSRQGRRANVAGAYAPTPDARARLDGRRVLLIDDVFTTGATLEACARACRRAGAVRVHALTLARVVRPGGMPI